MPRYSLTNSSLPYRQIFAISVLLALSSVQTVTPNSRLFIPEDFIMVQPDRPPKNGINRMARKIYNPIGFTRFYNFVFCKSNPCSTSTNVLTPLRDHIRRSSFRLPPRTSCIHELQWHILRRRCNLWRCAGRMSLIQRPLQIRYYHAPRHHHPGWISRAISIRSGNSTSLYSVSSD